MVAEILEAIICKGHFESTSTSLSDLFNDLITFHDRYRLNLHPPFRTA